MRVICRNLIVLHFQRETLTKHHNRAEDSGIYSGQHCRFVIIKIVNQIDRIPVIPYSPDNQLVHHSHCNRSDNSYFCSNSGRIPLTLSFQFHHTQMDGAHAGKFLANLQNKINRLG